MTVESATRKQQFTLDQVTTQFDFTFPALSTAPTDIKAKNTTGSTITPLTYSTHFTVTVSTDNLGGTLWLADATAVSKGTLTIYRETTNLQESDYDDYNQFPANTLETDLDRRTMIAQEHAEDIARVLLLDISVAGVTTTLPTPVATEIIGWDSAGTGLENYSNPATAEANASSYATTALGASTVATSSSTVATSESTTVLSVSTVVVTVNAALTTVVTFSNSTLSTGVLPLNHGVGIKYIGIEIFDNNDNKVMPDEVTPVDTDNMDVDLTSYGTLTGTWRARPR